MRLPVPGAGDLQFRCLTTAGVWCPCSAWCPGCRRSRPTGREWLVKDLVAGIVLTTLLVPQGMAYAELTGLPPITGLYTSILCLAGYAVFGSWCWTRILRWGR